MRGVLNFHDHKSIGALSNLLEFAYPSFVTGNAGELVLVSVHDEDVGEIVSQ